MLGKTILALATGVTLIACVSTTASAGPNEDAVMNADRAFNVMAQQKGIAEAFRDYAAPNAVQFERKPEPVRGRAAIYAHTKDEFADGGKLEWAPKEAVASKDGTLGTTWGRWTFSATDDKGQPIAVHGTYVTVWQKQPDGSWKFTHDIGQPDLPPPPPNAPPPPGQPKPPAH